MSPLVKVLMMLLAAEAFQQHRSDPQGGSMGGGLGDMLSGLGGGLSGGLPGGLSGLLDQFRQNGYGDHVDSWVSPGQNQRIAPDELSQALRPDTLDELEQQTGLPCQQLLSELSEELPDAVGQFTPDGRLPTNQGVSSRWFER